MSRFVLDTDHLTPGEFVCQPETREAHWHALDISRRVCSAVRCTAALNPDRRSSVARKRIRAMNGWGTARSHIPTFR